MAEQPGKQILKKPPGYRDPNGYVLPGQRRPPPRKLVLPPSLQSRKKRRSCRRICCCCFFVLILILIVLILISVAIFYLWFDPKLPVFHLQSFSFRHFNVTVKSDGTYLNTATLTRVEIRNPNGKLTYYYGNSEVEVSGGKGKDVDLGSTKVAGFTQAKKNVTSLKIETKSNEVLEDGAGARLLSRYRNRDLVVNVGVRTSVGVILQGFKIGPLRVKVFCGGVSMKALDRMPKCTINFLQWINIH